MVRLFYVVLSLFVTGSLMAQSQDMETEFRKLFMATATVNNYYVDSVDTHRLIEDAISGMLLKLDPHSSYTNAEETKKLNEPLQGSFDGIGIQFNLLEDTVLVIQPVPKGPSEKAGIVAGDRIVSVADTLIAGVKMSREEIMSRLRGRRGSIAHLGVKREGLKDLIYFDVKRDKIPVHSVDAAFMVTPEIGLIRFNNFAQTTHGEMLEAINGLKAKGMKSLIVDLTQNGGGFLQAAAEIGSEFLPAGDMVVYTQGRVFPRQEFRSRGGNAFQEGKLAILVDEYSASAAEILAGAVQDHDRGVVIGRRTFGKGLVQRPLDLPDGSMIRLTVAKYYTPSGRCIQKPYEKGKQMEYHMDLINRFNNGELTNADSIHLPDSLKFYTLKEGRTVYGGGGIMPDCFVPLDTTKTTRLYREISARNLVVSNSLRYLDKLRKRITKDYDSFEAYKAGYSVPQWLIDRVYGEAKDKGINVDVSPEEKRLTTERISLLLKALLARDVWDMSEYFAIIYEDNEMVLKAVELLQR